MLRAAARRQHVLGAAEPALLPVPLEHDLVAQAVPLRADPRQGVVEERRGYAARGRHSAVAIDRGHQRLTQCVAESLPFHDGAFDVAICCDVFEHLKDDSEGFAEVVRVLKPGGIMVISVPALQWLWSEHDIALSHFRRYEKHQIRDLMKVHGLEISKLTYGVGLLFPAVVASRLMGRLVPHRPRAPHTQVSRLPCMLNQPLLWIQDLETFLIPRWGLPIGASVIAVGRKPL